MFIHDQAQLHKPNFEGGEKNEKKEMLCSINGLRLSGGGHVITSGSQPTNHFTMVLSEECSIFEQTFPSIVWNLELRGCVGPAGQILG